MAVEQVWKHEGQNVEFVSELAKDKHTSQHQRDASRHMPDGKSSIMRFSQLNAISYVDISLIDAQRRRYSFLLGVFFLWQRSPHKLAVPVCPFLSSLKNPNSDRHTNSIPTGQTCTNFEILFFLAFQSFLHSHSTSPHHSPLFSTPSPFSLTHTNSQD